MKNIQGRLGGLAVDGVVGLITTRALGLIWGINPYTCMREDYVKTTCWR